MRYLAQTGRILLSVLLLTACVRDPVREGEGRLDIPFRPVSCGHEAVRSLLTSSDIETRVTAVTLAAYREGKLESARHFARGEHPMTLSLEENRTYTIYAFVNMGDLTALLPGDENALPEVCYTLPSYETIDRDGLPMSGCLEQFSADDPSPAAIPVRRYFSKITATLRCDWDGASVTAVRIRGMNGKLPLAGPAAARCEDDLFDGEELDIGSGPEGTFVFYVPENRQGKITGISASSDKSPDRNPTVRERQALLTYLEAEVRSNGTYSGTVRFRSCLGGNATDDFDIERNTDYRWTIHYHEDGLQDNNWKTDTDELEDGRVLDWIANPILVRAGETYRFEDLLETNLPQDRIVKTLSGEEAGRLIQTYDQESFTVRGDAAYGLRCDAEAKPAVNSTADLIRTTVLKVTDARFIRWHDHPLDPVKEILIQEYEPEISNGDPLFLTGFEMGDDTGCWYWKGKRISLNSSLAEYLAVSIPASLTGGKSGVSARLFYGDNQDECFNAQAYDVSCGVLQLYHPYVSFCTGTHDLSIYYKDDPDCAVTLRLRILPADGEVTYKDVYYLVPKEATIEAGETQAFEIQAETIRYIGGRYDSATTKSTDIQEMTWTSSDESVATVGSDGTATGVDTGTATIRVRFRDNGKLAYETLSATLHVTRGWTTVRSLQMEPESADLLVGSTRDFVVTLTTLRYFNDVLQSTEKTVLDNRNLTWQSSVPSVATVSNGRIRGIAPGQTVVTATFQTGGETLTAESTVRVKENNGINVNSGWDDTGSVILD